MDDRRFDALTRSLAKRQSRRAMVGGIVGLGVAALGGRFGANRNVEAARRPTPTPKPVSCPPLQTRVDGQCVCMDPLEVTCGPDCCPKDISECCDNACCYGSCYGEELCCPPGQVGYEGVCCTPKSCADLWPEHLLTCDAGIDDGCGGKIFCGCPEGWQCTSGSAGSAGSCLNMTTTCISGITVCGPYPQLAQCVGGGAYACSPDINGGNTCATHELGFCGGSCSSDVECGSGYACAQACDQFCDNYGCLQLPPG